MLKAPKKRNIYIYNKIPYTAIYIGEQSTTLILHTKTNKQVLALGVLGAEGLARVLGVYRRDPGAQQRVDIWPDFVGLCP